jgi:hypothetical protein
MLTWDTTLRLVKDRNPSPILVGLVLEELESEIIRVKMMEPLSEEQEVTLRGFLLKRFVLRKKIQGMINGQGQTD